MDNQLTGKLQPRNQLTGKLQPPQQLTGKLQPPQQLTAKLQPENQLTAKLQPPQQFGATIATPGPPGPPGPEGIPGPEGPQGLPLAVQDEGTALPQRSYLNFTGVGVTASDDLANDRTTVAITGTPQSPWTSDIDAGGHSLSNVPSLGIGRTALAGYSLLVEGNGPSSGLVSVYSRGYNNFGLFHQELSPAGVSGIAALNDLGNGGYFVTFGSAYGSPALWDNTGFIASGDFLILTGAGNPERMRVTAAGLVGIGRTPTTYPLEVQGDCNVVTGGYRVNGTLVTDKGQNYIPTESGAANALVATLTGATLAAGLEIRLLIAHTLQAGANTLNLNGAGAKNIRSHRNPANNIAAAYTTGCIITLIYDGTQWQDQSQ